jgi:chloramphenicol 3-O-phosphotransferase
MSQIVIVSGPSGAGKSSVCRALCERYDRTVHLETDLFFDAIQMGRIHPMRAESDHQNRMVSRAVARAATAYAQELYAVFIDGVIGPHLLPVYLEELAPAAVPVHFVLLMPSVEESLRRVAPREEQRRMVEDLHRELHDQFIARGGFAGITIDNTHLTANETADRVMAACGAGDCLVYQPVSAGAGGRDALNR